MWHLHGFHLDLGVNIGFTLKPDEIFLQKYHLIFILLQNS